MFKNLFASPYLKRSVFFAPDDGGGGGDPAAGGEGGNGSPDPKPTLTQAQVDAIVQDRVARAKESAKAETLKELGLETVDAGKAALAEAKKLSDEKLTDDQKKDQELAEAKNQAVKEKERADAEKQRADQAEEKYKTAMIDQKVSEAATEMGFRKESLGDISLVIDRSKITEKDGKIEGIKEALEAISSTRPHWLEKNKGAGDGKQNNGTPDKGKRPQSAPSGGEESKINRPPIKL